MAVPFYILASNDWEFLLLHMLTSIWWYQCCGFRCSDRCVVVSHYVNLHFPSGCWCWKSLHMLILSSWWNVCSLLCPFSNRIALSLLSFEKSVNLFFLLVLCLQIFSRILPVDLFAFLSILMHKTFNFDEVQLHFSVLAYAFGVLF